MGAVASEQDCLQKLTMGLMLLPCSSDVVVYMMGLF